MIREPEVRLIDNPIGQDAAIQRLQILIGELHYMKSLGKAYTGYKSFKSREYIYPAVYLMGGEYYDALPNDNLIAQSFIRVNDPVVPVNYNPHTTNSFTVSASIIVWYNLDEIKKAYNFSYTYRFDEVIRQDVLDKIKRYPELQVLRIFEKPEEVYRGYTINHLEKQTLFFPYGGFRMDVQLSYQEDC